MRRLFLVVLGLGSVLYVLNPGWGIFEFLPDNLPLFGNLDEAAATGLVLWCWREFRKPALPRPGARG
jgi:hypothetical protein